MLFNSLPTSSPFPIVAHQSAVHPIPKNGDPKGTTAPSAPPPGGMNPPQRGQEQQEPRSGELPSGGKWVLRSSHRCQPPERTQLLRGNEENHPAP